MFNLINVKLNTINWDDKDTILTQAAIDSLDALDLTTCWFWGKACYHENALQINTDQTTGDARTKYSRPAFYLQGLLKRAVESQGYSFIPPVPDLAISSNHDSFFFTSYQKTIDAPFSVSGTLAITGLDTNDFEHADLTVTSTTINIGTKSTAFRFRGNVSASANVDLIVRATDDADPTKIEESKITINSSDIEIDFTTSEFQSDDGYTVDVYFSGTSEVTFDDVLMYTNLLEENEDLSTNPWLGYKIKAHDNLPDLTYLDTFRTICVISNKYQDIDTYNKVFDFASLANLNKINAKDWSDKFVIDSDTIDNNFAKLAKINYLKYTNDSTVDAKLGESSFATDNESLPDETDYIKLKFGASNDVSINSNTIAYLKIYSDTTRIADQEISMRLFNCGSDLVEFGSIDWRVLKVAYYNNWFNSLFRIRAINCSMNLNKLDFLSWQPNDIVYVEHFKSSFIVLANNNFMPGVLTKVKLLNYGR